MPTADSTNSYIILSAAENYFDSRLHAGTWNDATDDDKERALIHATRLLDSYLTWHETPDKTAPDQAIMDATCEMALVLLNGDTQVRDDMEGIESVGLGSLSVKARGKKRILPPHVYSLVAGLADRVGGGGVITIERT